jgi:hypothetical protein
MARLERPRVPKRKFLELSKKAKDGIKKVLFDAGQEVTKEAKDMRPAYQIATDILKRYRLPEITATAKHYDEGKLRYDLLDAGILEDVVAVFTYGSKKYDDNNWRKGMPFTKLFGSIMRHMWLWYRGEDIDKESGLKHLAHAICDIMMVGSIQRDRKDCDDRIKIGVSKCKNKNIF